MHNKTQNPSKTEHKTEQTPPPATSSDQNSKNTTSVSPSSPFKNQEQELTELLQRTRADFENFRKRVDEQRILSERLSAEKTVRQFLPLLDAIQFAVNSNPSLAPLAKTIEKTAAELGLEIIIPELNSNFDPTLHEALSMSDDGGEKEVIAEILRPGYRYHDNVIRAALVRVKTI